MSPRESQQGRRVYLAALIALVAQQRRWLNRPTFSSRPDNTIVEFPLFWAILTCCQEMVLGTRGLLEETLHLV